MCTNCEIFPSILHKQRNVINRYSFFHSLGIHNLSITICIVLQQGLYKCLLKIVPNNLGTDPVIQLHQGLEKWFSFTGVPCLLVWIGSDWDSCDMRTGCLWSYQNDSLKYFFCAFNHQNKINIWYIDFVIWLYSIITVHN